MSRSRRKTPIMGMTTCRSEKKDKQIANRKLRVAVRTAMAAGADLMPMLNEISSVWSMGKDGRQWIRNPATSRWMRK
jgi:hypothetical protein